MSDSSTSLDSLMRAMSWPPRMLLSYRSETWRGTKWSYHGGELPAGVHHDGLHIVGLGILQLGHVSQPQVHLGGGV